MNKIDYKAMFAQIQSVHSAHQNKLEVLMNNKTKRKMHRKPILAAAAIALAMLLSLSAYAIVTLLSPSQVARELEMDAVAQAFENGKGTVIDETITSEGHVITLMGMTAGKNLLAYYPDADAEQTALVVSIRREDGSPLDLSEGFTDQFSSCVLFSGYKPWMLSSRMLGSGGSAFERDGVLYLVLYIDENIEMLADRTVSLAIWDTQLGMAPGSELLKMEDDGAIAFVDGLQKAHTMFTLPLDASKANPAKVRQVLEDLGFSSEDIAFMQDPNALPPDAGDDDSAPVIGEDEEYAAYVLTAAPD